MTTTLNLGKGEIDALLARVPRLVSSLESNATTLANNANSVLAKLPAPVAASVSELLAKFVAVNKKLIALLAKPLTEPGDPFALWQAGSDWTNNVGNKISGQVAVLGSPAALDDDWNGQAATRYGGVLAEQRIALSAIKKITDPLHTTLTSAANSIIALWVGVAAAFVSALPDIVGAAVAAAGIVTAPAAIALGVKVVLQLAVFGTGILLVASNYLQSVKTSLASLQQLKGIEGFVPDKADDTRRHWPTPTQPLNNGKDW